MSEIISNLEENKNEKIRKIGETLKQGKIVVFPTETVYGIGVNGLDKEAVRKLYEVKQRPLDKPISLLVSDFEMIEKVAKDISELEYKIMRKYFPGPLTIVLNKKDIVPDEVTANGKTVGIRMPDNEDTLKIIKEAGFPIATPSANISGRPSGTNIDMIMKDFEDKVDLYVDGGESKIGMPSTIIRVENNQIKVLRQGSINIEI